MAEKSTIKKNKTLIEDRYSHFFALQLNFLGPVCQKEIKVSYWQGPWENLSQGRVDKT